MDLQLLVSEIAQTPNLYNGLIDIKAKASRVGEIKTIEDIDNLVSVFSDFGEPEIPPIMHGRSINVISISSQISVTKSYSSQSKDGFFFI